MWMLMKTLCAPYAAMRHGYRVRHTTAHRAEKTQARSSVDCANEIFTIGFTRKSAERFFESLRSAGVERVIDIRLHNESQLAGFSKRRDLEYFLRVILGIEYVHLPELAPTEDMLRAYRAQRARWPAYERQFRALLEERRVEETLPRTLFTRACLLCSEPEPDHCHRLLVVEHLARHWPGVEARHIT
jgi:uncharacterized protein (DUF488 family)